MSCSACIGHPCYCGLADVAAVRDRLVALGLPGLVTAVDCNPELADHPGPLSMVSSLVDELERRTRDHLALRGGCILAEGLLARALTTGEADELLTADVLRRLRLVLEAP